MYGSEQIHAILRLLTAIEIACFQSSYDPASAECTDLIADERIYVPPYTETLHNACKLGEYTDIVVLYAVSAVIGRPITSVYPVHNEHVEAWNGIVVGRQVHQQTAEMKLMWSTGRLVDGACIISLNHLVVLHPVPNAQQTQPLPDTSLSNSAHAASQQSSNTAKPKRRRQHPQANVARSNESTRQRA